MPLRRSVSSLRGIVHFSRLAASRKRLNAASTSECSAGRSALADVSVDSLLSSSFSLSLSLSLMTSNRVCRSVCNRHCHRVRHRRESLLQLDVEGCESMPCSARGQRPSRPCSAASGQEAMRPRRVRKRYSRLRSHAALARSATTG